MAIYSYRRVESIRAYIIYYSLYVVDRRVRGPGQLFEKARKMAPCIVFIDEIDALRARASDPLRMGGGNQEARCKWNIIYHIYKTCMSKRVYVYMTFIYNTIYMFYVKICLYDVYKDLFCSARMHVYIAGTAVLQ